MSDDKKPDPVPHETSVQKYVANSNIDAHLIADMLRIEGLSNEVKGVAQRCAQIEEKSDRHIEKQEAHNQEVENRLRTLERVQLEHGLETQNRFDSHDTSLQGVQANVKKLEGWLIAIVGIAVTTLITLVITLATTLA